MHKIIVASTLIIWTYAALAQQGGVSEQRSSNPRGIQIQNNMTPSSGNQTTNTNFNVEGARTKNPSSESEADNQARGNIKINVQSKNSNALSIGKSNTANNKVGTIGGN